MEFSSLKDVTDILETETLILKKLQCIQVIVEKFMPDVRFKDLESDVFIYLLPAANDLVQSIFERNLELLTSSDEQCSEVKDYLQVVLQVFNAIDNVVGSILKQKHLQLQQIYSVPLNVFNILNSTFTHCKKHNHLYQFVDAIQDIQSVFKSAQEVYRHLLQLLDEHMDLDDEDFILEMLDLICDIGESLIGINMKSMADTWKFYSVLMQRYSNIVMDKINLAKPLKFVSNEVSKNIREICDKDGDDEKVDLLTLKISNFFVKLASKLFETYGSAGSNSLYWIEFFCTIYCYFNRDKETFRMIEENVLHPLDFALFKFLANQEKLGSDELEVICNNRRGFVYLLCYVFSKSECPNNEGFAFNYLDIFLKVFTKDLETDLRANVISLFVMRILSVSYKEFMSIEELLFNTVLEGSTEIGLFASDIWVLLLRNAPPTLSYDTILNVISKMSLERPTSASPTQVKLCNLLRNFHKNLPNGLKVKLLEKYSPEAHMHVWNVLGLEHLTAAKSFLKAASLNDFHRSIDNRDFTRSSEDFNSLIFSLTALANIASSGDKSKMCESVKILWDFDVDLDEDYFGLYVENLCLFTTRVLVALPAEHQSWVLGHLEKALIFGPHMKVIVFRMLINIAKKDMVPVAWRLVKLCTEDRCRVIKLYLDKAYAVFKSKVGGDSFDLSSVVCAETKQQDAIANEEEDEQFMESAAKKLRIEDDAAQDALDLIQHQVKLLVKLQRQGKISREQSKQIYAISNKLQHFV